MLQRVRGDRLLRLDAGGRIASSGSYCCRRFAPPPCGRGPRASGVCSMRTTLPPPPDCPKIITLPGSPPKLAMLSRTHSQRRHQVRRPGVARVGVLRTVGRQIERAENVQAVIDADDHHVAELAEASAVVRVRLHRRAVGETAAMHPHHHGLLHRRCQVLRPDVQVLAVLVGDEVAMRKDQFIGADRGLLRARDRPAPTPGRS